MLHLFLCVSLAVRTNLSLGDDFSRGERLLKEEQNNSTPKNKEQRVVIVRKHNKATKVTQNNWSAYPSFSIKMN